MIHALLTPKGRAAVRSVAAWFFAATLLAGTAVHGAEPARDYVLGEGDAVRVVVFQNPDLTLDTRVSESGLVSYPLLGQIKLGGLSVSQAEQKIADGLRNGNFLKQPQVTLLVVQIRGNQASALGLFNRPGRYPLEVTGMRVSDLVAQAGGVATGGSDIVILTGLRDGKPLRAEIDLPSLLGKGQGEDPVVRNGDVLYVDRMPTVYIYGEVQRPGPIRLERDMNLMQALATGGGLTPRGTDRGIRVHRRGGDGQTETLKASLNDKLQDGDVVFVKESLF